jgi:hypothetical protein
VVKESVTPFSLAKFVISSISAISVAVDRSCIPEQLFTTFRLFIRVAPDDVIELNACIGLGNARVMQKSISATK